MTVLIHMSRETYTHEERDTADARGEYYTCKERKPAHVRGENLHMQGGELVHVKSGERSGIILGHLSER